jgi:hypothetical protein
VSRKTVPFTMRASAPRSPKSEPAALDEPLGPRAAAADPAARPDDWVRDRDFVAGPSPADDALTPARVLLDLAAERTLAEVLSLSFLVPFALGWFWWVNAWAGRGRI